MAKYQINRSTNGVDFSLIGTSVVDSYEDATAQVGQEYWYKAVLGTNENVWHGGQVPSYEMEAGESITVTQTAPNNFQMDSAFSFEIWCRIGAVNTNVIIFERNNGGDTMTLRTDGVGTLYFEAVATAAVDELQRMCATLGTINKEIAPDTPFHIIVTYDGSKSVTGLKIYINGVEIAAYNDATDTLTSTLNLIGADWVLGSANITLGMFRLFSAELSQADVTTLYNSGFPLYDASAIGNIVAEYKMINDTEAGGIYTIIDSSGNANNGVTVATEGDERGLITDYKGIDFLPVLHKDTLKGRQVSLNGLVHEGSHLGGGVNYAPWFEYKAYPSSIVNYGTISYIGFGRGGYLGYSSEGAIMKYNHTDNVIENIIYLGVQTQGLVDGHEKLSMIQKQGTTDILICQEIQHGFGEVGVYLTDEDLSSITKIATVTAPTRIDYPNLMYLGSRLYMFARGWDDLTATCYYYSDNHGVTWTQGYKVTNNYTTRSLKSILKYDTSEIHLLIYNVDETFDTDYVLKGFNYLKSSDGETFENIDNSFSKDITVAPLTQAEVEGNYNIDLEAGLNVGFQIWSWDFDDAGNPVILVWHKVSNKYRFYYYSGGWTHRDLPITPYVYDHGFSQNIAAHCVLISKGGNNYDLYTMDLVSDFRANIKYSTTDGFQTMSAGERISKAGRDNIFSQKTFNLNQSGNFLIACNSLITGTPQAKADMFLYESIL